MTAFLCILAGLFFMWLGDKAWKSPSRWTPSDPEIYSGNLYLDGHKIGTYTTKKPE